jgi:hypothetical protein
MESPYRSTRLRTLIVTGMLGLHAALLVVVLAGQAWCRHVIAVGDSLYEPSTRAVDQLQAFAERSANALYLACAVAFLVWLYRAFANLPSLGATQAMIAPGQRATPGGAIGVWFIPFANLVLPFRAVRHLYLQSQPVPPPENGAWVPPARTPLLGWWWGLFLASNFASNFSSLGILRPNDSVEAWVELTQRMVLPHLLDVAAAILCIAVVRAVERRQVEQRRDQLLRVPVPMPTDQLR